MELTVTTITIVSSRDDAEALKESVMDFYTGHDIGLGPIRIMQLAINGEAEDERYLGDVTPYGP